MYFILLNLVVYLEKETKNSMIHYFPTNILVLSLLSLQQDFLKISPQIASLKYLKIRPCNARSKLQYKYLIDLYDYMLKASKPTTIW